MCKNSPPTQLQQAKSAREKTLHQTERTTLETNATLYSHLSTDGLMERQLISASHYHFKPRSQWVLANPDSYRPANHFDAEDDFVDLSDAEATKDYWTTGEDQSLSKAQKALIEKEKKLIQAEGAALQAHAQNIPAQGTKNDFKEERALLQARLEAIEARKAVDLEDAGSDTERIQIEANALDAIVQAREEYLHVIPVGHPLREDAVKQREKATDDRRFARWKAKYKTMPAGEERDHERKQYIHKYAEGMSQSIVSHSDKNCEEDVELTVKIGPQATDVTMVNTGKAYMGGSKPTYFFEGEVQDANGQKVRKRYIYKKAENCMGRRNQKGAVMTALGARFQQWLDPQHAIPAVAIQDKSGTYIASVQEMIPVMKQPTINLESWQQDPNRDPAVLTRPVLEQLMTFHVIDWLLCNFDTKGENLLQRSDGQLVSIDKEGAMSKIDDAEAQTMSLTYCPHTDEPIYNLVFRLYRDKKLDLPFDVLKAKIDMVERMDTTEYMQMFDPYLAVTDKKKKVAKKNIEARKTGLRQAYITFLNSIRPDVQHDALLR